MGGVKGEKRERAGVAAGQRCALKGVANYVKASAFA